MKHIKKFTENVSEHDIDKLCDFYYENCDEFIENLYNELSIGDVRYDNALFLKTRCRAQKLGHDWYISDILKKKYIQFLIDYKNEYPKFDNLINKIKL